MDVDALIERLERGSRGWSKTSVEYTHRIEAAAALRELKRERDEARRTSQFHKDNHLSAENEIERLRDLLREARKDVAEILSINRNCGFSDARIDVHEDRLARIDKALEGK